MLLMFLSLENPLKGSTIMKKLKFTFAIFLLFLIFILSGNQKEVIASVKPEADVFTDIGANLPLFGSAAWGDYDQDGDLDVLISGYIYPDYITKIYRNDNGTFTDINANLEGALKGSIAWGDFDNDNDLDILLTGESDPNNVTKIYRNDNGNFVDIDADINGYYNGDAEWGDYDLDGDLDIAIAGTSSSYKANIYRNNHGQFNNSAELIGVANGSVSWGDYDNDNDLDLAIAGYDGYQGTEIYQNVNNSFIKLNTDLLQVQFDGSAEWGDIDNDGDLDLLLNSCGSGYPPSIVVYENNNGSFILHYIGVNGKSYGNATLGDYDNDGDLDIVVMGQPGTMTLYRNNGNFSFSNSDAEFTSLYQGNVEWGDYNNDGKLDILATGYTNLYPKTLIYQNNSDIITNTVPTIPNELMAFPKENSVILTWNAATDQQTPTNNLTYNIRIGTTPGGSDVFSPMSNPANGYRYIPQSGNMGYKTMVTINGLKSNQEYYWSVQSVDSAFAGSLFAVENNFSTSRIIHVTGSETGWINTAYSITATASFSPPTSPITFTWATTEQDQIINSSNDMTDVVSYNWANTEKKS
jgi:predicted nucleotidyltransferase